MSINFILVQLMLNSLFLRSRLCLIVVLVILGTANTSLSEDNRKGDIPTRYGMAAVVGKTFDPVNNIYFTQLSGFIMWDYDKIWHHWAPDPLRFKVEGTAGTTVSPHTRAMVSVGMMALYYLEFISSERLMPYVEGGIGAIYTDFQVEGQGSRFNFNPQIGIGMEFKVDSGKPYFTALRLSHISNAGLQDENRGVNSFVWMLGRFF
jgi:lipid A 3-O-deacylase